MTRMTISAVRIPGEGREKIAKWQSWRAVEEGVSHERGSQGPRGDPESAAAQLDHAHSRSFPQQNKALETPDPEKGVDASKLPLRQRTERGENPQQRHHPVAARGI